MFRTSRIYALVGLPIVVVAIVLVALSADPQDPNPKGTLAAIFAILAGFFVILFLIQARDLARACAPADRGSPARSGSRSPTR